MYLMVWQTSQPKTKTGNRINRKLMYKYIRTYEYLNSSNQSCPSQALPVQVPADIADINNNNYYINMVSHPLNEQPKTPKRTGASKSSYLAAQKALNHCTKDQGRRVVKEGGEHIRVLNCFPPLACCRGRVQAS